VFHCEWNEFGKKILKYYWPNAISYGDITKTDFSVHRGRIDVLTGGFPCQPFSHAGKREGSEDDRYLWPEVIRAIREIQPTWFVGENVAGLVSMGEPIGFTTLAGEKLADWVEDSVLSKIIDDLESEGYAVQAFIIPACAVNAPHRRDRIWIVAHNNERDGKEVGFQAGREVNVDGAKGERLAANADGFSGRCVCRQFSEQRKQAHSEYCDTCGKGLATDTGNERLQRGKEYRSIERSRQNGNKQLAGLLSSSWQNFPTQSPICSRDDGISTGLAGITFSKHRNESIKAYGNAIVPQVAHEIFKAIKISNNG
jgi:DNA (cytosine-5)-methyltransferase 1